MNTYKVILFDLDGTLSDPKEGITKSVQYALQRMNIHKVDVDQLEKFIGPPLQVSFADYYGFNKEKVDIAIGHYRARFKEKGMYENELYPQIPSLLKTLKESDMTLVVATSKPTVYSEQILKHFKVDDYFDLVVGSNLDGTRTSKEEIIQNILNTYYEYQLEDFIMVGDRKHDVIGANQTGIDSLAVTYGYGSLEELREFSPTYIVNTVDEIKDILT
ncbi:HAD family hydrolase [Bacillus carboniphilus]|uniref:HAD family hydrolase n=1 Tax=Bacillus carboniphilus TaxID=86663 RepID=A0ABY9JSL8_9BACI|nr:HAD family hydrolase [Bacillus carboniphilus]WLR42400.1 HAD family hydrolase [Bacillus carboniphilus]